MSEDHSNHRDRVIADSGWGVKPDDQPANAREARGEEVVRVYPYRADEPDVVRKMLRAQRKGFNTANAVRIEPGQSGQPGRTVIIDINKDEFPIEGLTWGDVNLLPLLEALGASFDPQGVKKLTADAPARTFDLSRVWAWGAERTG